MTRPVAVRVSQATRLTGSSVKQASRMASEIWSAILSGWPSVTDSEVNKYRFFAAKLCVSLVHGGVRKKSELYVLGEREFTRPLQGDAQKKSYERVTEGHAAR